MSPVGKVNRIERRKLEFRDRITSAALHLFERQGVNDTSVAAIIKQADIAHKTFFNHFPSKDHLLLHIVESFSESAYSMFREGFVKQQDPRKRLEYCLLNVAKVLEPVNEHYRELLHLYLISGVGSGTLQQHQKAQFTAVIRQIMSDARRRSMLKAGFSVDTYTEMTVNICVATLLSWSLEPDYPLIANMKKAIRFLNVSVFVD